MAHLNFLIYQMRQELVHQASADNWDILEYILFAIIQYTHCL